ncbi:effector-associated constant component EACC1 [Streptodolium elevatio]|uniref:Uncharacterized protein n=1 Tax=Streptodolium elevatio TaxID=3157996 RepID=A0ABV3DNM7_9ACTN
MESRLMVEGSEGPESVADLRDWLGDEDLLHGRVRVPVYAPRPGDMGAWSDTLLVAVGTGGAVTALARSLAVYLRQPRRRTVRVKVVAPDGSRTELTVQHARNVAEVEQLLRTALHSDAADGAADDGATDDGAAALPDGPSTGGAPDTGP